MNKYLQELLKLANTVIIPGLGALTITNDKTGDIFFMSYLKHDDGKLAEFIASKEGIELIDAKNNLAKYVREISTILDKGESFDIFNFGKFIKNESGEIVFIQSTKIEHKLSESTYSIDVNEKLASQLETFPEIEIETAEEKEQPSLDSILNEKQTETNQNLSAEEKNTSKESQKKESLTETTIKSVIPDTAKDITEQKNDSVVENTKLEPTITSSLKDEKSTFSPSTSSLEEESDKKIYTENTGTEITKNNLNKTESATSELDTTNSSQIENKEQIIEKDSNITNSDLSLQKETQSVNDNKVSSSHSTKKSSNKKLLFGILIPLIATSFVFLYLKVNRTSSEENKKSKLTELEKSKVKSKDSTTQTNKIALNDTVSNEVIVEETVQSTSATSPIPSTVTPSQITPTKAKTVYQQPTATTLGKTTALQIQVIVGTFTQKANASIFIQQLNQKGYTTGKIIEDGGLILVSLGSFPTIQEAANFGRLLKLPTGYWLKATK